MNKYTGEKVSARLSYPTTWEINPGWEKRVCEPVTDHYIAPRQAKAVLRISGILMDEGFEIEDILNQLEQMLSS